MLEVLEKIRKLITQERSLHCQEIIEQDKVYKNADLEKQSSLTLLRSALSIEQGNLLETIIDSHETMESQALNNAYEQGFKDCSYLLKKI